MAKVYVSIGYADQVETRPGVWSNEPITERTYYGDLTRHTRRNETSGDVIDDINIANEVSIVAEPFAYQNFHLMKYAKFSGAEHKWKIKSVEVQHHRLILTIGGLYND